jgi:hypothetical protein
LWRHVCNKCGKEGHIDSNCNFHHIDVLCQLADESVNVNINNPVCQLTHEYVNVNIDNSVYNECHNTENTNVLFRVNESCINASQGQTLYNFDDGHNRAVHVSHSGAHCVSSDIFHNVHVQGQTLILCNTLDPINANVLCGVVGLCY